MVWCGVVWCGVVCSVHSHFLLSLVHDSEKNMIQNNNSVRDPCQDDWLAESRNVCQQQNMFIGSKKLCMTI